MSGAPPPILRAVRIASRQFVWKAGPVQSTEPAGTRPAAIKAGQDFLTEAGWNMEALTVDDGPQEDDADLGE